MKRCSYCLTDNFPNRAYCKKCWGALYGHDKKPMRYGYGDAHIIDRLLMAIRTDR